MSLSRHVVYLSIAAAGSPRDTFARICGRARHSNAALGIGGVLLYDGQHFAQWMCGPDAAIHTLLQRIAADPRHVAMRVLLDGWRPAQPEAPQWRAGYTAPEALPVFVERLNEPSAEALNEFRRLLPAADLWPPVRAS